MASDKQQKEFHQKVVNYFIEQEIFPSEKHIIKSFKPLGGYFNRFNLQSISRKQWEKIMFSKEDVILFFNAVGIDPTFAMGEWNGEEEDEDRPQRFRRYKESGKVWNPKDDFLPERLTYLRKNKIHEDKTKLKKPGPREIGRNNYDLPAYELTEPEASFLEPKINKRKSPKNSVVNDQIKKLGPREIGRVKDYKPPEFEDKNKDKDKDKNKKSPNFTPTKIKKEGPRDIGRNNDWKPQSWSRNPSRPGSKRPSLDKTDLNKVNSQLIKAMEKIDTDENINKTENIKTTENIKKNENNPKNVEDDLSVENTTIKPAKQLQMTGTMDLSPNIKKSDPPINIKLDDITISPAIKQKEPSPETQNQEVEKKEEETDPPLLELKNSRDYDESESVLRSEQGSQSPTGTGLTDVTSYGTLTPTFPILQFELEWNDEQINEAFKWFEPVDDEFINKGLFHQGLAFELSISNTGYGGLEWSQDRCDEIWKIISNNNKKMNIEQFRAFLKNNDNNNITIPLEYKPYIEIIRFRMEQRYHAGKSLDEIDTDDENENDNDNNETAIASESQNEIDTENMMEELNKFQPTDIEFDWEKMLNYIKHINKLLINSNSLSSISNIKNFDMSLYLKSYCSFLSDQRSLFVTQLLELMYDLIKYKSDLLIDNIGLLINSLITPIRQSRAQTMENAAHMDLLLLISCEIVILSKFEDMISTFSQQSQQHPIVIIRALEYVAKTIELAHQKKLVKEDKIRETINNHLENFIHGTINHKNIKAKSQARVLIDYLQNNFYQDKDLQPNWLQKEIAEVEIWKMKEEKRKQRSQRGNLRSHKKVISKQESIDEEKNDGQD